VQHRRSELNCGASTKSFDGKPDLTGVWQPASTIRGSWEEANAGDGLGGTGKNPSAPVALGLPIGRPGRTVPALGRQEGVGVLQPSRH